MKRFKNTINSDNPVVKDHCINGFYVLPGVSYLDICARCLQQETFSLSHLRYPNALYIPEGDRSDIYLDYDEINQTIEIYHLDNRHKIIHFHANYDPNPEVDQQVIEFGQSLDQDMISMKSLYEIASRAHINHGPFMCVQGYTSYDKDHIQMNIGLSQEASLYLHQFYLHPALLDGATFSIAALYFSLVSQLEENKLYLPLSIDRVEIYQRIDQSDIIVLAEKKLVTEDLIKCDITLNSLNGKTYLRFVGLTNKCFHVQQLFNQHVSEVEPILPVVSDTFEQKVMSVLSRYVDYDTLSQTRSVSFFDLGFDSSQLMSCSVQLEKTLSVSVYPTLLFEYNTLNKLIEYFSIHISPKSNNSGNLLIDKDIDSKTKLSMATSSIYDLYQPSFTVFNAKIVSNQTINILHRKFGESSICLDGHTLDRCYYKSSSSINDIIVDLVRWISNIHHQSYCLIIQLSHQQRAIYSTLQGLVLSFNKESKKLKLKLLMCDDVNIHHIAARLLLTDKSLFRYAKDHYYIPMHKKVPISHKKIVLKSQGSYLIVGGGDGLSKQLRDFLRAQYQAKLWVIGHRDADLSCQAQDIPYQQVNLENQDELEAYIESKVFDGIFFLAGCKRDCLCSNITKADIDITFTVKPFAFETLLKVVSNRPIHFVCAFSSISAEIGQAGQSVYAAANSLLNYIAQEAEKKRLQIGHGPHILSINWPYWRQGGMQLAPELVNYYSKHYGVEPLETQQGMDFLERSLQQSHANLVVASESLLEININQMDKEEESILPDELTLSELDNDDIAIIGVSFELPDATTFDELHNNLLFGRKSIRTSTRAFSEQPYPWGGYLENIDQFDPLFFNISPNEARLMDPQERLFLSHAWHCLEDAGYGHKNGQNIGVIAAAMFNSYQNYSIENQSSSHYPQSILAAIANRVSYSCNLSGPSFCIDSMCSSALNALDLACQTLKNKSIDAMLVGAVNICSHPYKLRALQDNKFLSPNGESMPFSSNANGYVPGEGIVVLMVKNAKKALSAGDSIYGVIKSIASDHNGQGQGFTVPNANAQARTILEALKQANLSANDIGYVEAHGTSTALGDPIEVEGLYRVFSHRKDHLMIGSIKGNMGHLESVSGFASLVKILAQNRYKVIYQSINATPFNPKLTKYLEKLKIVTLNHENIELKYAGISCFGAGGSNTHCIVGNLQHNLKRRKKQIYDLKSYWLEEQSICNSVHWLQKKWQSIEEGYQGSLSLSIHQVSSSLMPKYFNIEIDKASVCLFPISIDSCWDSQTKQTLSGILAKKASLYIILLAQEQQASLMAHAMILSDVSLTQAKIKCVYLENAFNLTAKKISELIEKECTTNEERLVNYQHFMKRMKPSFKSFVPQKETSVIDLPRNLKFAVLGGLGEIGMQFCLTLKELNISRYDVYGRSPFQEKQQQLMKLDKNIRYIQHDFVDGSYKSDRYDVIINCLGMMPGEIAHDLSYRKQLKLSIQKFIEQSQPKKIISISSLSAWIGFSDDPSYAIDNACTFGNVNFDFEHIILYCPLILTTQLETISSSEWLNWSKHNQGLSIFSLSAFKQNCATILTLPPGEYIPFVGKPEILLNYLQNRLKVIEKNNVLLDHSLNIDPLAGMIESILGIPSTHIDGSKSFQQLGFNSLTLTEFSDKISRYFNRSFNPSQFFEIHSLNDLRNILNVDNKVEHIHPEKIRSNDDDLIVICGHVCQFPESDNVEAFWQNLVSGVECTQSSFQERFECDASQGNIGLLSNIDKFDHYFFNISEEEAKWIDPQQRLLLQLSWHLFENVGIVPSSLKGNRVGVFVAIQFDDYARLADRENSLDIYQITGCAKNFAANRLSYYYDFYGPSETIDTACSSSMSAIARAIQALRNDECDYAIVMGASLICDLKTFELTQQLKILSSSGHCRPFDKSADGYIKGEGIAGIFLTKRMFAENRNLRIDASISGISVNHGGRAQSITAPNGIAQQDVMRKAYEKSPISPKDIDYIEAHATATKLGDPVEYQAISTVFSQAKQIGLGSVKANIGHTEPVSGLAGIIKAIQMLIHQCIPRQINFEEVNPYIDLQKPFYIQRETVTKSLQHIGVNSFGFGGSNGHCILSAYKQQAKKYLFSYHLLVLSAHTQEALDTLYSHYCRFVEENPELDRTAMCKTLSLGREHFSYRACWLLDTDKPLLEQLLLKSNCSKALNTVHSIRSLTEIPNNTLREYLSKIADVFMSGHDVDWNKLYQGIDCYPIVLPMYTFEKHYHWLGEKKTKNYSESQKILECYQEEWQPCFLKISSLEKSISVLLIAYPQHNLLIESLALQEGLTNFQIVSIHQGYEDQLLEILKNKPERIYYLGGLTEVNDNQLESIDNPIHKAFLLLLQLIQSCYDDSNVELYIMASYFVEMEPNIHNSKNPSAATLFGLTQSFSKEFSRCRCHCLAISDTTLLSNAFSIECQNPSLHYFDGNQLYTRKLIPYKLSEDRVNLQDKVIVLVGGSGQVGQQLIPHLLKQKPKQCICISRRAVEFRDAVIQYQVDCTDRVHFVKTIDEIIRRFHQIDYLIHLGSSFHPTAIMKLDYVNYCRQISAKVFGTQYCIEGAKEPKIKNVLISSSAQVYTQNKNHGAYTAACFYSDALVHLSNSEKVSLIHWGFWQQADETINQTMRSVGIEPINGEQGFEALLSILSEKSINLSCFLVDKNMKSFMPIEPESQSPLIDMVKFHQRLEKLELYALDIIWSALITSGVIFIRGQEPHINEKIISESYKLYLKNLIDHVINVARIRNHNLCVFDKNQLLIIRWRQFRQITDLKPFLNLLEHCVSFLPQVITGKITAQEVLFPHGYDNLVRNIYQHNPLARFYNRLIAKFVHELSHNRNPLRILEVGAGTGATTAEILVEGYQHLDYTFSDVNLEFLEQAKIRFSTAYKLSLQRFDINTDQAENEYDVIIASNVLHVCENLSHTLLKLNRSLSKDGYLVINEAVSSSLFLEATFGLLPQWHQKKQNDRIANSPLLSRQMWRKCLEDEGFAVSFCQSPEWVEQTVIIARLCDKKNDFKKQEIIVNQQDKNFKSKDKKRIILQTSLSDILGKALKINPESLQMDRSMKSYGLDSISAIHLAQKIKQNYGLDLSPMQLLQDQSIEFFIKSLNLEY